MAEQKTSTYKKITALTFVAGGSVAAAAVAGEISSNAPTALLSLTDIATTAGVSVATYLALDYIADKIYEKEFNALEAIKDKFPDEYNQHMKSLKKQKLLAKMMLRSSIPVAMIGAALVEGKDWNAYLKEEVPGTNLEYGELFILSIAGFIIGKIIEAIQNKMAENKQVAEIKVAPEDNASQDPMAPIASEEESIFEQIGDDGAAAIYEP